MVVAIHSYSSKQKREEKNSSKLQTQRATERRKSPTYSKQGAKKNKTQKIRKLEIAF